MPTLKELARNPDWGQKTPLNEPDIRIATDATLYSFVDTPRRYRFVLTWRLFHCEDPANDLNSIVDYETIQYDDGTDNYTLTLLTPAYALIHDLRESDTVTLEFEGIAT